MEHQTEWSMLDPINPIVKGQPDDEAIKMIQYYEPLALQYDPRGYCVCTSEGKDSRVLGHLYRRAGVKHFYLHSITGIDPPELIYFQRRNFQDYKDMGYLTYDVMYEKSMWKLMVEKLVPPLRRIRYCCAELKERRTKQQGNAMLTFGVRKYESVNRSKKRDELEIVAHGRSGKNLIMAWDNDENRRTFENCYAQCEKRLNPIAYWPTNYIWDYSRDVGLEQCCLYQDGFARLGCIGCPNACCREKMLEFQRWPDFEGMYRRAFRRMTTVRKQQGLKTTFETGDEWFEWWVTEKAQEETDPDQIDLWEE